MADRPNNRGRKSRKKVCGFCVDKVEQVPAQDISATSQQQLSVRVTLLCSPIPPTN